jgi:agmatine deiminase
MARSNYLNPSSVSPDVIHYHMPAEWEPHSATWLAWPHYHGDWPGKFEPIPWVYAEIVRNLARHERVELIVNDAAAERAVRKILELAGALTKDVRFHRWGTNRVWVRDSGCIFVAGGDSEATVEGRGRPPLHSCAVKFRFNAWAKYSNWRLDDRIGSLMANVDAKVKDPVHISTNDVEIRMRHPREEIPREISPLFNGRRVVLEGGSIDVNGRGTLLTTEECLLSKIQERNPGMARKDYEKIFAEYLGTPHVIWLGKGIVGDDTHGHVDDLARFVAADTVVTVVESNPRDANFKLLRENLRRLRAAHDQDGKRLNVVEIPMPRPVIFEKRRLPASYANFYIANGVVLVPVFNDPNDRVALNTLAELFPAREIVPIYAGDLVWGLGTMHCMTQQQPARGLKPVHCFSS